MSLPTWIGYSMFRSIAGVSLKLLLLADRILPGDLQILPVGVLPRHLKPLRKPFSGYSLSGLILSAVSRNRTRIEIPLPNSLNMLRSHQAAVASSLCPSTSTRRSISSTPFLSCAFLPKRHSERRLSYFGASRAKPRALSLSPAKEFYDQTLLPLLDRDPAAAASCYRSSVGANFDVPYCASQ